MKKVNKTDLELVKLALAGDSLAYGKLIKNNKNLLIYLYSYRFQNTSDIDDFINIVFTRCFRYLHTFHDGYKFSTWMGLIARQCYADYIYKGKKQVETVPMDSLASTFYRVESEEYVFIEDNIIDQNPTPYDTICTKERARDIREAVDSLPDNLREIISLRFYREYTYEELVAELKLPMGTVKTNIHKAKKILQTKLINLQ